MAGHPHRLERDPGELERLVALEQDVGRVGLQRELRGREVVDPLERDPLFGGHMDWRARRAGQFGDTAEVVPVAVRDQDRDARGTGSPELALELGRIAARVDHDRFACCRRGPDDVAIRPDRAKLVAIDGEAHGGRV